MPVLHLDVKHETLADLEALLSTRLKYLQVCKAARGVSAQFNLMYATWKVGMKSILLLCSYFSVLLVFAFAVEGHNVGAVFAEEPLTCKVAPLPKIPDGKVGEASPAFTWQALAGCTDYQFYLSNAEAILSITWVSAEEAGCVGGSGNCRFTPDRIFEEGDYGWWIRGWQPQQGTSKWSSGTRFTVDLDICAKVPEIVAPIDTAQSGTPAYQWQGVYGCEWYQLVVSGPDGNVLREWVKGDDIACVFNTVCSYAPEVVLPPGRYFWWIRGWSRGTRIGLWTAATAFTITE